MKILGLIIAGALAAVSQTAAAAVIFMPANTPQIVLNDWGNARQMTARANPYSSGPVNFGSGVTFKSTSASSVIGNAGAYNFANGQSWNGTPMAGLNAAQGAMTFDFDHPVASVMAEMNWAAGFSNGAPIFISIFNSANVLLETFQFTDSDLTGFYGFTRNTADISRLVLSNGYIGARNFYTNDGGYDARGYSHGDGRSGYGGWGEGPHGDSHQAPVPEPAAWLLMIVGFGATGAMLRRARRTDLTTVAA